MTYDSIDTVSFALTEGLKVLDESVRRFPEELRAQKPEPDVWSLEEIVEHVAIVEEVTVRLLTSLIAKARLRTVDAIEPIRIPDVAGYALSTRVRTTARFAPTGTVTLEESRRRIQSTHEQLDEMRQRIEAIDIASVRFPHPILGPLDIGQWLAFIAEHRMRHARQIDERLHNASS